jgi:pimeloyl-ACP methyl ester carboxylesterase
MPRALLPSGIELEYDTFGAPTDPTLLLVAGFTAQMTSWEDGFCRLAADVGHRVVRFDNRDCGLSTKLDGVHADDMAVMDAVIAGAPVPDVAYTLSDMAGDGIGLLDHLGVDRAHVVGASMGGMIVQHMAIEHPERLHSVTSIMSTIGDRSYGTPTNEALAVLLSPQPPTRDEFIAHAERAGVWSSSVHFDADAARRRAAADYDRSFYPEGATRQLAAIYASGDRTTLLRDVSVPMLVIHGLDDTLIHPSGGRRTAELVPGAALLEIEHMGHDRPEPLWPVLVGAIADHVAAVEAGSDLEVAS